MGVLVDMKRRDARRFDPRTLGCRCDECPLGAFKRERGVFAPVPPEGPETADIVAIGEHPGTSEEQYLRPFIGASGSLLERTFNALGVVRGQVLMTNAILCRPPGNDLDTFTSQYVAAANAERRAEDKHLPAKDRRPKIPTPQEACRPHVEAIADAAAKRGAVVLALGKLAYWSLIGKKPKIMNVRGSFGEYVQMGHDKWGRPLLAEPTPETADLFAGSTRLRVCASINPAFATREGNAPYREVLHRDIQRALRWHTGKLQWQDPRPLLVSEHPPADWLADWLRGPGPYTWDLETAPAYALDDGRKDLQEHYQDARENKNRIIGIYDVKRRQAVVVPWISIDGRIGFAPGRGARAYPTPPSPLVPGLRLWEPTRTLAAPSIVDQTEAARLGRTAWWHDFDDYHYSERDGDVICAALAGWLERADAWKVGHFANYFDRNVMLRMIGPHTAQAAVDTILLARIWNSELPRSLYFLGTMHTDVPAWKASKDDRAIARQPRSQRELNEYNVIDNYVEAETAPALLDAAREKWPVAELDHKVQAICLEMKTLGLWVHEETRAEVEEEARGKLVEEQRIVAEVAGPDFNPRSTKQLGELLYDTWKYPIPLLTKSGKPSTSEDAIRVLLTTVGLLHEDHRVMLEALWRSRGWQKDLSDVILPMRRRSAGGIVHEDGVLRCDYTAHVPATGRISAGGPNTQNWRKRLRRIVRPRPGHLFLMADYDQIELRLMSAVAQVTAYLQAFARGDDPHAVTASLVYGEVFDRELRIYKETGTKTERFTALRRFAKTFVYAVLYGGGASTVYDNVAKAVDDDGNLLFPNMTFAQVEASVKSWMRNAREVPIWWEKTWKTAEELGYVEEPILGRRRHMPQFLRNEAVNHGIQGGAAIIMGLGLVKLRELFPPDYAEGTGIVNQMHDAVTVEVTESRARELAPLVTNALTCEFPDKLPHMTFSATAEIAIDWSEKHWRAPGSGKSEWDGVVKKTLALVKRLTGAGDASGAAAMVADLPALLATLRPDRMADQFALHKAEERALAALKVHNKAR